MIAKAATIAIPARIPRWRSPRCMSNRTPTLPLSFTRNADTSRRDEIPVERGHQRVFLVGHGTHRAVELHELGHVPVVGSDVGRDVEEGTRERVACRFVRRAV